MRMASSVSSEILHREDSYELVCELPEDSYELVCELPDAKKIDVRATQVTMEELQKKFGKVLEKDSEQDSMYSTITACAEMLQSGSGGIVIAILSDAFLRKESLRCKYLDDGITTKAVRAFCKNIKDPKFADFLHWLTSDNETDRWEDHELEDLSDILPQASDYRASLVAQPKDGAMVVSAMGSVKGVSLHIKHQSSRLVLKKSDGMNAGTRHASCLGLAERLCQSMREDMYRGVVFVRSEGGGAHAFCPELNGVPSVLAFETRATSIKVTVESAVSMRVYTHQFFGSELSITELKVKLMSNILPTAPKGAKLILFHDGHALFDNQQLGDIAEESMRRSLRFTALVYFPEGSATTEIIQEAKEGSHKPSLAIDNSRSKRKKLTGDQLSAYLLSIDKGSPCDFPRGYCRGHGVVGHEKTGISIRCPAFRVAPITLEDDDIVLYHYTQAAAFSGITGAKGPMHLRASVAERAHFGDGVYASSKSPEQFGSKQAILLNNYTNHEDPDKQEAQIKKWREQGAVDYCIPLIVPRSMAMNVMFEKTKEMKQVAHTARHFQPVRPDRNIFVIVLPEFLTTLHEDAQSIVDQLDSDDCVIRLSAVEALAQEAASGDEDATRLVMTMLGDPYHNVRVGAVWATACAASLTPNEASSKLAGLADDPVKQVREAVQEALTFLNSASEM